MRYNNYHKHTHKSGIFAPDTYVKPYEYCERANELGHTTYFTTEHGFGGDIFEAKELCEKYNLKCIFACEGYIVKDPLEKDSRNYHIMVIARTNVGRRKINKAISNANKNGFYYKPRFFINDLLCIDKEDIYITTACVGGILRDEDGYNDIFMPLVEKFQDHMFLEIQSHVNEKQIKVNLHIKEIKDSLYEKYGCRLISANDSHYIYPKDDETRNLFLKGKGIKYPEEEGFILDYPDYETLVHRYFSQNVFSLEEIREAIDNTLIFDDCEEININKQSKMPNINQNLTREQRFEKLKKIAYEEFDKIKITDEIKECDYPIYYKKLDDCLNVIKDTMEMDTQDYFLLDYELFKIAIDKYGGILTNSGRGSNGCFYLNRVLGLTQLDSETTNIPMYPDRFMSVARTLENRSYPDIDANIVDQEPFIKASKELLGELGCYPMLAYGTMQESEAFRNTCRACDIEFEKFNEVAKDLSNYKNSKEWKDIFELSNKINGTVVSASTHPCSFILFEGNVEEEIGVIRLGEFICAVITSDESDTWKYLKNDYLVVSVLRIIHETCDLAGIKVPSLNELRDLLDEDTWNIYKNGMTSTINQVDSDYSTHLAMKYKPHSVEDVAKLVAAIRPSFDAWRDHFINREQYTNGVKAMDDLFSPTDNYILFQENIMQYFEWLDVTPAKSIGLIKKISKKKIKESDFKNLEENIKTVWIKKTGSIDGFDKTWDMIQGCMSYGFNTPHGLGYAYDSLYCAYLKSHYPLEYYTVTLNLYQKDDEKTKNLVKESKLFNIKIKEPRFRYSKAEYQIDRDTRTIYKGMASIKFMNSQCSDELYDLRDSQYNNFIDLLYDIKKTSIDARKLEILIRLDFFEEFGNSNELIGINDMFIKFKSGEAKTVSKEKIDDDILRNIIARHSNETLKQYNKLQTREILYEINDFIISQQRNDFSLSQKISSQLEYLGYIGICTNKEEDRRKLIVMSIKPLKSKNPKDFGQVWCYAITTKSVGSGKDGAFSVYPELYKDNPFKVGDIIYAENVYQNKKGYWNLSKYHFIYD